MVAQIVVDYVLNSLICDQSMKANIKKRLERVKGRNQRCQGSGAILTNSEKHEHSGFEVFLEVQRGWLITKLIGNILPILVAG